MIPSPSFQLAVSRFAPASSFRPATGFGLMSKLPFALPGIETSYNLGHSAKALLRIAATPSPIVTRFRLGQS